MNQKKLCFSNLLSDAREWSGEVHCGEPISKKHRHPGCYLLLHQRTGKVYVGSSGNVYHRVIQHRGCLNNADASVDEIINLCQEDGGFFFEITLVLTSDRDDAYDKEQQYLDKYYDTGELLNRSRFARHKGGQRSEDTKERIRSKLIGKQFSDSHLLALRQQANKDRTALVIEGRSYPSYNEAARQLSLDAASVRHRVKSSFPQWEQWRLAE